MCGPKDDDGSRPVRCEQWCNEWTCKRAECSDCAEQNLRGCTSGNGTFAGALKNPAWGCCADKAAKRCGECRWATKGGYCAAHKVNCQVSPLRLEPRSFRQRLTRVHVPAAAEVRVQPVLCATRLHPAAGAARAAAVAAARPARVS